MRPTLDSLTTSIREFTDLEWTFILVDSSPTLGPVEEVQKWASEINCTLVVEHLDLRAIMKVALNVAFQKPETLSSDIVIVTNDDVLFRHDTITNLVNHLINNEEISIAVGVATLDENYSKLKGRRAGAWQLQFNKQLAHNLPNDSIRAEGSIWAARGDFISGFRYPIGSGSISDDVELATFVSTNGLSAANAKNAVVLKVPTKGFKEFSQQTRRFQKARSEAPPLKIPRRLIFLSIIEAFVSNPIGFISYVSYRLGMYLKLDFRLPKSDENWERQQSTSRS